VYAFLTRAFDFAAIQPRRITVFGLFPRFPPGVSLVDPRRTPGGFVRHNADDMTIERWKTEPRLLGLEYTEAVEQAPPLWKDLTVASALAALLWAAALVVLR
jgi:hypothetical protein